MAGNIISAVFDSYGEAADAVHDLRRAGAKDDRLSIILRQNGHTKKFDGSGDEAQGNAGSAFKGLFGGAAAGSIVGLAVLAIPGVGPLAAAGAIAASAIPEAAIIGAGAGALAGGFSGLLKKHGVSDDDARYYQDRIKDGAIFVSVDPSAGLSPEIAREILFRHGGHNASHTSAASAQYPLTR